MLLLAMFSVAARYSDEDALPDGETMWSAGDIYCEHAMNLIGQPSIPTLHVHSISAFFFFLFFYLR